MRPLISVLLAHAFHSNGVQRYSLAVDSEAPRGWMRSAITKPAGRTGAEIKAASSRCGVTDFVGILHEHGDVTVYCARNTFRTDGALPREQSEFYDCRLTPEKCVQLERGHSRLSRPTLHTLYRAADLRARFDKRAMELPSYHHNLGQELQFPPCCKCWEPCAAFEEVCCTPECETCEGCDTCDDVSSCSSRHLGSDWPC